MPMFKGIEFRYYERRHSQGKGPKVKLEVCVSIQKGVKIWARDNGPGGLALYQDDKGKALAEKFITSWLPSFDAAGKADRKINIRAKLDQIAAQHPYEPTTDASTTPDTSVADTPNLYTTTQSDPEMLQMYHDDECVPNQAAAVLIGEAKGRSEGKSAVPPNVVIETKREALRVDVRNPWLVEPYIHYQDTLGNKTSRKRKRCETPPPTSPAQHHWDCYYANNLNPEMKEMYTKFQALVDSFLVGSAKHQK